MSERVARFVVEVRAPGEDLVELKRKMGIVRRAIIDTSKSRDVDLAITGVDFCEKTPLPVTMRVRVAVTSR